jgi:predicted permease
MRWRHLMLFARALRSPRRAEHELAEELAFHLEMQARKHEQAGMDPAEAARLARLEFGNLELAKEDARDVRGTRFVGDLGRDVRYALRGLRRAPIFALSVVLTIGLGIGIVTSVFTAFDAYVLRPFDVRDPWSLFSIQWRDRRGRVREFTRADYDGLRRDGRGFADLVAFHTVSARLDGVATTGDVVTPNLFSMLGLTAALGRTLLPQDDASPAPTRVVVLSHSAWQRRFGGDSNVVGRRVALRGAPFRVVGVARAGFEGLFKKPRDFWVPLGALPTLAPTVGSPSVDQAEVLSIIGRLAPGTTETQGRASMTSAMQALTVDRPDSARATAALLSSRATAIPVSAASYAAFLPIVVAFGLVLLLACANVANMLLARGLARRRELGIRLALGAGRQRIVRQLVTEGVVLALPAAALGVVVSWLAIDGGIRTLFTTLPADLAPFVRFVPLHPDGRVVCFAFVVAVASALFFSLAPALQTTKLDIVDATRGTFAGQHSPARLRSTLIVVQVTVSALLLVTSGMLLRDAARLGRRDTGLRTRDVVSIEVDNMWRGAVLDRLRDGGLTEAIATAATLPLDARFPSVGATTGDGVATDIAYNRVSASYFDVLNIGIVSGRTFTAADERAAGPVAIVSQATARRLWPRGAAAGQLLHVQANEKGTAGAPGIIYHDLRIIGVARDVVIESLEEGTDRPVMYLPLGVDATACCVLARVRGDPSAAKRALDADFEHAMPGAVDRIDRLDTFLAGAVYPYRAAYWIATLLGLIALLFTTTGVYGVVAYVAGQRTHEIGIRIALGARRLDVIVLLVGQSVRHALVGIAAGGTLAVGIGVLMAAYIEGLPSFDPLALAGASVCIFVACAAAASIPSQRAARLDPTAALRRE